MRVLAVGNMYPPQHLGGYELVWQSAMRALRGAGHETRVLTTDLRLNDAPDEEQGVARELRWYWRDHAWPSFSARERLALERHNARVFDRHLAELRPDVVTWWSMGGMSLSLIGRARRAGLRSAAFVHDDWLLYGPQVDAWLRMLRGRRLAARAAWHLTRVPTWFAPAEVDEWLFVSDHTRGVAEAAVGPLPGVRIAHSGIHEDFLDPQPEREWRWRLLYVGRIDARKGIETAVQALDQLPAETTLTVVGGGEELAALAHPGVRRTGPSDRAGLKAAYADADAVVFPVVWDEPWGLVPLEAMGMGRPVVATGRGGSAEYLRDGENALLFDAGDAVGLADAVRRLAADATLRERLRAGGLATAPRHTEAGLNAAVLAAVERLAARR